MRVEVKHGELIAVTDNIGDGIHIRNLVEEITRKKAKLILFQDNTSTMNILKNGKAGGKSKHIKIRFEWFGEQKESGKFDMRYVKTGAMKADGMTKAKGADGFSDFCRDLGVMNLNDTKECAARTVDDGSNIARNDSHIACVYDEFSMTR